MDKGVFKICIETIDKRIEEKARLNPNLLAACFNEQSLSYAQLNERANQLAHYLKALGIETEERVAICLERSIDILIAMVAILKAGACYVPLDPKQPMDRLSFILKDSAAKACITRSVLKDSFAHHAMRFVIYDDAQQYADYLTTNLNLEISKHQLAYMIYTSGTTGNPKGVLIEHHSVVNYADWFASFSGAKLGMRIDWSGNYMFDMAVTATIVPFMLGLSVVVCCEEIQRHFQAYLRHINAHQIHIIKITPSYFKELLREIKSSFHELTTLQTIVLGGEQLSAIDCANWLAYYPMHCLINEYGPTEATVAFSAYRMTKNSILSLDQPAPIGHPGNHMYGYILDEDGQEVAEGDEGELYIGGVGLARGYLNLPDLSKARFVDDPFCPNARLYKTGDLCRRLSDGVIEYLGRIDRQVKIRGFRVELTEVEQCLEEHPNIQDAIVFVRENLQHDKQLVAYYILKNKAAPLMIAEIRTFMLTKLPHYMIPASIVCIDAFPMAENGKLDESLLPLETVPVQVKNKPRSNLERIIAKIWAKELCIPRIGVDENFWELGGHSFIAARIIAKMNQMLDLDILPQQFYEAMTVQKMAELVKGMNKHTSIKKNLKTPTTKAMPLSDFQTILWACKTFKPKAAKLNIIARKRLQGQLDIDALQFAFDAVLHKHRILSYRISKILPIQLRDEKKAFALALQRLDSIPEEEAEYILWDSMDELAQFSAWSKTAALIRAKLFFLKDNSVELQVAIPHIISDGLSMDILLAELSEFYLLKLAKQSDLIPHDVVQFSDYIYAEQLLHQDHASQDENFWSEYLKDAHLFSFPQQYIVKELEQKDFNYSSYVPIPTKAIHHLEVLCRREQTNFSEALSAVLGLALTNCCSDIKNPDHIFMNIIKSSRDNLIYDETIGCFIRIEPIKLCLNKNQTFKSLLAQVREFIGKHVNFQQSSSLLKLASMNSFYRKKKDVKYFLAKGSIFIYQKLIHLFKMKHEALALCPSLSLLDGKDQFMIYLNIWNNFVNPNHGHTNLFGLQSKRIKMHQHDLLTVDYLFEVCFLRDENHKPYVVISSNLTPYFREKIAYEMIRIMNEEMMHAMDVLEENMQFS